MRMFFTVLISVLASSTATYAETLSADKIKSDIIGKIMCVDTKSGKACARHNADGTSQIISGLHPAEVFAGIRCAGRS